MHYQVYAFGSNARGQLGIGHYEDVDEPTRCITVDGAKFSSRPIKLAAGGNHSLILCEDGKVWQCGCIGKTIFNDEQHEDKVASFKQIVIHDRGETIEEFAFIAATWQSSTLVTADKRFLYTYGIGRKGELGRMTENPDAGEETSPMLVRNFPPRDTYIVSLSASMSHTVSVLSNGEVFGWGWGRKGQLGDPKENVLIPRKIQDFAFCAIKAVCGRTFTYVLGAEESGHYAFLGSIKEAPPQVHSQNGSESRLPAWVDIQAGWGNVYLLDKDHSLWVWGHNNHGQKPRSDSFKLRNFAVGSEHVVAESENGDLLTWGWGEHGNCGPSSAISNRSVCRYLKPEQTSILGTGCATSFIVKSLTDSPDRDDGESLRLEFVEI